jgi:hypothetical protein
MRLLPTLLLGPALVATVLSTPSSSRAACDVAGADAADLASTYEAIETSCPCDGSSRSDYRACARNRIMNEIAAESLNADCRRQAFRYARFSRCGKPGAVVCCRINRNGRERHRVPGGAFRCQPPAGGTACVSAQNSIVTGCDASGCVSPTACGNGIVESGEECDPPDGVSCDFDCQQIVCGDLPNLCGNGVLDAGEACEPPGTATCDRSCQTATCGPPPEGELTLACLDGPAAVAAGSNGDGVLAAWNSVFLQPRADVLARRLDATGAPIDPSPFVVSDNLQCQGSDYAPAVASDGTDYAVSWFTLGEVPSAPGFFTENVYARGVAGGGGPTGAAVLLKSNTPIGSCRVDVAGPTDVTAGPEAAFTVFHREVASCFPGGVLAETPKGTIVPLPSGAPLTAIALDPLASPPGFFASGPAAADALGVDTLAAWSSTGIINETPPFVTVPVIRAGWIETRGASLLTLGLARWASSPDVTAGDASFLVAWAARVDDAATDATEIRAFRVTRAVGALDPAFGLLVATSSTEITRGPVAAFDGEVWLVAWVEVSGGGHDLRAAAVRPDGTVVDATSRLLAAGVSDVAPAVASTGDGTVLVMFNRPAAGGKVAINTIPVEGS